MFPRDMNELLYVGSYYFESNKTSHYFCHNEFLYCLNKYTNNIFELTYHKTLKGIIGSSKNLEYDAYYQTTDDFIYFISTLNIELFTNFIEAKNTITNKYYSHLRKIKINKILK